MKENNLPKIRLKTINCSNIYLQSNILMMCFSIFQISNYFLELL